MRPTTKIVTANGTYGPFTHDHMITPFHLGFDLTCDAGTTATVTVEHTRQDPNAPTLSLSGQSESTDAVPVTWNKSTNVDGFALSATTPAEGEYTRPIFATRFTVANIAGGGKIYWTMIQAGAPR